MWGGGPTYNEDADSSATDLVLQLSGFCCSCRYCRNRLPVAHFAEFAGRVQGCAVYKMFTPWGADNVEVVCEGTYEGARFVDMSLRICPWCF